MIDSAQPFLFPFFGLHPSKPHPLMRQYNYWSWEDGLWDLLQKKHISKKSIILLPDFYCMDVVKNIKNHGYTVEFYRLDKQLQISRQRFLRIIKQKKPSVVIVFHPLGIKNRLMTKPTWIQKLSQTTLVIEDAVHWLVNPQDIKLYGDNHVVMTSLRKVSPLPGSFMYGTVKGLNFHPVPLRMSSYTIRSFLYYFLYRFMIINAYLFHLPRFLSLAHTLILQKHDDLIGDSITPHGGYPFISNLYSWINFQKVYKMKRHEMKQYRLSFKHVFGRRSMFYRISMKRSDEQYVRAYPIGLKKKVTSQFLTYLTKQDMFIHELFVDCPWSRRHSILYLPLGFHMNKQDIRALAQTFGSWDKGERQITEKTVIHSPHLLVQAANYFFSNYY